MLLRLSSSKSHGYTVAAKTSPPPPFEFERSDDAAAAESLLVAACARALTFLVWLAAAWSVARFDFYAAASRAAGPLYARLLSGRTCHIGVAGADALECYLIHWSNTLIQRLYVDVSEYLYSVFRQNNVCAYGSLAVGVWCLARRAARATVAALAGCLKVASAADAWLHDRITQQVWGSWRSLCILREVLRERAS
jgi:hypothetical protein